MSSKEERARPDREPLEPVSAPVTRQSSRALRCGCHTMTPATGWERPCGHHPAPHSCQGPCSSPRRAQLPCVPKPTPVPFSRPQARSVPLLLCRGSVPETRDPPGLARGSQGLQVKAGDKNPQGTSPPRLPGLDLHLQNEETFKPHERTILKTSQRGEVK